MFNNNPWVRCSSATVLLLVVSALTAMAMLDHQPKADFSIGFCLSLMGMIALRMLMPVRRFRRRVEIGLACTLLVLAIFVSAPIWPLSAAVALLLINLLDLTMR